MTISLPSIPSIDIGTVITSSLLTTNLYGLANHHYSLQLDKKQAYAITLLASQRIDFLCIQLGPLTPHWVQTVRSVVNWAGIFFGLGGMALGGVHKLVQRYQNALPENSFYKKITITTDWILTKVFLGIDCAAAGFQYSDRLLNLASFVSYVALCTFGFPLQGAIGLVGLLLLGLKRYSLLPAVIDHNFARVIEMTRLITGITQPSFFLFRLINIICGVIALQEFIVTNSITKKWLPSWRLDPFKEFHKPEEITPQKYKTYFLDKNPQFEILKTYVHAPEVGDILPQDLLKDLENRKTNDIFSELDKQVAECIKDRTWAKAWGTGKGYETLKNAAITGRVGDALPADVETLQTLLKALAYTIVCDPQSCGLKLQMLNEIGEQCNERWTSEVQFLLAPKTRSLRWSVHHLLAKSRGGALQEQVLAINNSQKKLIQKLQSQHEEGDARVITASNMAGGENGVHMLNAFHAALRPFFRTYEGEIGAQLQPYGIFGFLMQRYCLQSVYKRPEEYLQSKGITILNLFAAYMRMISTHAGCDEQISILLFVYAKMGKMFDNVDGLVDLVYESIRPRPERTIPWQNVQSWIGEISEKINPHNDDSATSFYEKYIEEVEADGRKLQTLSKKGVQLLLWDLGVLQLQQESP